MDSTQLIGWIFAIVFIGVFFLSLLWLRGRMIRLDRMLEEGEKEQALKMRRSMVAKVDLSPGQKLQLEHVEFNRPGTGISPTDFQLFLGCKVTKHIESGDIILPDDLS